MNDSVLSVGTIGYDTEVLYMSALVWSRIVSARIYIEKNTLFVRRDYFVHSLFVKKIYPPIILKIRTTIVHTKLPLKYTIPP